jgi:hypothetical protein
MQVYELFLPVYKRGDDLAENMELSKTPQEAFLLMAEQYDEAAKICREVASLLVETSEEIHVEAASHTICLIASEKAVESLLAEDKVRLYTESSEDEDEEDPFRDEILPESAKGIYLNSLGGAWYIDGEGKPQFTTTQQVQPAFREYDDDGARRDAEDLLLESVRESESIDFGVRVTDKEGRIGLILFLQEDRAGASKIDS